MVCGCPKMESEKKHIQKEIKHQINNNGVPHGLEDAGLGDGWVNLGLFSLAQGDQGQAEALFNKALSVVCPLIAVLMISIEFCFSSYLFCNKLTQDSACFNL